MAYSNRSLPFTPAQQAILTTLLYSDIFSFPLTKDELWKFLLSEKKLARQEFEHSLHALSSYITYKDGYFCLKNKEEIISQRIENLPEVTKKMKRARSVAEKLSTIPSVLFIGVSGGLAVGNVTQQDDIDFVFIVKKNTLFVSRLLILGVLESLGVRRSRNQINTADTICTNLLLDETSLGWFEKYQDIYTAREIAQVIPLFEREKMYQQFFLSNMWIQHFLPNIGISQHPVSKKNDTIFTKLVGTVAFNPLLESLSEFLQMSLIKRHHTREIATKHVLAFHSNDYRTKTLRQLRLKVRQLGLLTKF